MLVREECEADEAPPGVECEADEAPPGVEGEADEAPPGVDGSGRPGARLPAVNQSNAGFQSAWRSRAGARGQGGNTPRFLLDSRGSSDTSRGTRGRRTNPNTGNFLGLD